MSKYAVKVGKDITLFLTKRLDWIKFTDAVAKAFITKIQNTLYAEVMNGSTSLPNASQFNKSGNLDSSQKATFDQLIEDVQTANDGAQVVIIGVKTALKKLTGLADVDWASSGQKDEIAAMGRLGSYEGTALVEIPQRFKENDVTKKLIDSNTLLIMPLISDNKFAKFVDGGETEIEISERGDTMDDQRTYEVQRSMGIGVITSFYFGKWTISA